MEGLVRGLRGLQGLANDKVDQNGVYPPWGVVLDREVGNVTRSQSARGASEMFGKKESVVVKSLSVVETTRVASAEGSFSTSTTPEKKDLQPLQAEGMSRGRGDGREMMSAFAYEEGFDRPLQITT